MNNSSKQLEKFWLLTTRPSLRTFWSKHLTSQGYQVAGFTAAASSARSSRAEAFDVFCSPILMMPGIDGIALTREGLQIDPN